MPDDVAGITLRTRQTRRSRAFFVPISIRLRRGVDRPEIENERACRSNSIGSSARSTATQPVGFAGRLHVPDDDAGRRSRRRGRDDDRRHADPSPARDPAPDDDPAVRAGARSRRAGRDPLGIGGGDLPAVRLRDARRSRTSSKPRWTRSASPGRSSHAAASGSSISTRRSAASRRSSRSGRRRRRVAHTDRREVALPAAPRRRVDAATGTGPRSSRCSRSTARRGLRHLSDQGGLGQPRPEERRHDPGAARRSTPTRSRRSGSGCSASTSSASSGTGAARCHTRSQLMVTEPRRLGPASRDAMWLRIIDLPAALEARTYRGPGSLVLRGDRRLLPLERRPVAALGRGGWRGDGDRHAAEPDLSWTSATSRRSTWARSGSPTSRAPAA